MSDYNLKHKVAVITGVSRRQSIGAAIARELSKAGVHIFATYFRGYDKSMPWEYSDNDALSLIEELKSNGAKADGIELDFRDSNSPALIFAAAEKAFGHVDILVNNAACSRNADIAHLTPQLLDEAYAVNLRGTLLLCSEFFKRHNGESDGRIIILTSGQGVTAMPEEIPYIVTKAGLDVFVKSSAITLAKKHITINAIDPGATDSGWMSKEMYEKIKSNNPMGRVGMPEDAAKLVAFLASGESQWITGQIIRSDGGGL